MHKPSAAAHLQAPQVLNTRPHQGLAGTALCSRVRGQGPVQVKQQDGAGVLPCFLVDKVACNAPRHVGIARGAQPSEWHNV